jgi:hypothetical protein
MFVDYFYCGLARRNEGCGDSRLLAALFAVCSSSRCTRTCTMTCLAASARPRLIHKEYQKRLAGFRCGWLWLRSLGPSPQPPPLSMARTSGLPRQTSLRGRSSTMVSRQAEPSLFAARRSCTLIKMHATARPTYIARGVLQCLRAHSVLVLRNVVGVHVVRLALRGVRDVRVV